MALDDDLNWNDPGSTEVWSPVHAWRALGQLRAAAAITPLLRLLHEQEDNDWASEELPIVFGMIGREAIPALSEYLANPKYGLYPRATAAHGLEEIARTDPTTRAECIAALSTPLEQLHNVDPELNGFIIINLTNLKAVEAASGMEQAFASQRVDESIPGDWEDVQIALGLLEQRITPAPVYNFFPGASPAHLSSPTVRPASSKATNPKNKAKAKRKQARASRAQNKKRK